MEIGNWKAMYGLDQVYRDAQELGLESNIAELETFGFTVVEPEKVASEDLTQKLRETTLSIAEREDLSEVTLNQIFDNKRPPFGRQLFHMLTKDAVYLKGLMTPAVLTLGSYMTGLSCQLYGTVAFIKDGPATPTRMHNDATGMPPPLPAMGNVSNISWLLSDYTPDNGTFYVVPGSHRYGRFPTEIDQPKFMGGHMDDDMGVPVVGKAGSLVVLHGNLWHGTYGKSCDMTRAHLVYAFCRNFVRPAEDFSDVSDDMLVRGGKRFAKLIGRESWQGYKAQGPNPVQMAQVRLAQLSPYA